MRQEEVGVSGVLVLEDTVVSTESPNPTGERPFISGPLCDMEARRG